MAKKKTKNTTLYAISIRGNSTHSLTWIDDHWYENKEGMNFVFTKEQVEKAKEQLPKHYILNATITSDSGEVEEWKAFKEKEAERAQKEALSTEFDFTLAI